MTDKCANTPTPYHCDDCEWTGLADDLEPITDVHDRVLMGEFMAAGCCPDCGSLVSVAVDDIPSYTLDSAEKILAQRGVGVAARLAKVLGALLGTSDVDAQGFIVMKPSPSVAREAAMALESFLKMTSTEKPDQKGGNS